MTEQVHKELVEAAYAGRALIGVDRAFARRVFTTVPVSAVEQATGEPPHFERLVARGLLCCSPLALLASMVASGFALGAWAGLAVPALLLVWVVNRALACASSSSAWPTALLVVGASGAHLAGVTSSPWATGTLALFALSLWCDRLLYSATTHFLRAFVLRNPRALGAFAEGVRVRWVQ